MTTKNNGWQVEQVESITRNPWFGVLLQHVKMPDGTSTQYYTVDFPNPAVGVVVRRRDEFLLIEQYRFIVDEHVWAIPSGGMIAGETTAQAAAREMEEETGYRPSTLEHILGYYPSYGCSNQRFEIFLAEDPIPVAEVRETNEVLGSRWFKTADVHRMVQQNQIVDGLSLTPLLLLLLRDQRQR